MLCSILNTAYYVLYNTSSISLIITSRNVSSSGPALLSQNLKFQYTYPIHNENLKLFLSEYKQLIAGLMMILDPVFSAINNQVQI